MNLSVGINKHYSGLLSSFGTNLPGSGTADRPNRRRYTWSYIAVFRPEDRSVQRTSLLWLRCCSRCGAVPRPEEVALIRWEPCQVAGNQDRSSRLKTEQRHLQGERTSKGDRCSKIYHCSDGARQAHVRSCCGIQGRRRRNSKCCTLFGLPP